MIHFPGTLEQHFTVGRCRAPSSEYIRFDTEAHTCDALLGSSGAPLFRLSSEKIVVGIHTDGFEPLGSGASSFNYARPMADIVEQSELLRQFSSASLNSAEAGPTQEELTFAAESNVWRLINSSREISLFEEFLSTYPEGKFANEARGKIQELSDRPDKPVRLPEEVGQEKTLNRRTNPAKVTVYIECENPKTSDKKKGSGVIVSRSGSVLTARHVAPDNDYECWGYIGSAARRPNMKLVMGRYSTQYDARLLRIVPEEGQDGSFDFVEYTELSTALQLRDVTAYGFPKGGTGQIDPRFGKITTTVPAGDGTVNTDGHTARGMSGGPVVIGTDGDLVGIIAGASLDTLYSIPVAFKVLAAQEIAHELQLSEAD